MARDMRELHVMERVGSECSEVLARVEESLRVIRLHLIAYQLQLSRLTSEKQVKITDAGTYGTEPATLKKRTS